MKFTQYVQYETQNKIILSYASTAGVIGGSDADYIWVEINSVPDEFNIEGVIPGKWLYDEIRQEIVLNPEYEEKNAQGLWYDWETHDWIPNPWI